LEEIQRISHEQQIQVVENDFEFDEDNKVEKLNIKNSNEKETNHTK